MAMVIIRTGEQKIGVLPNRSLFLFKTSFFTKLKLDVRYENFKRKVCSTCKIKLDWKTW